MSGRRIMYRKFVMSIFAVLLFFGVASSAEAQGEESIDASLSETSELWFVELASPPIADGGSKRAAQRDKNAFRAAASRAGLSFEERYAFDTLWNGLSVRIDRGELAKLVRIQGVSGLYPVDEVQLDPTPQEGADLFSALQMTGADIAQSSLGFSGEGVKVAIMDTGIDYHHPDLGGCFGPGCRVETGWDFVGDAYTGPSGPPPIEDPDPDDCGGHGTHVAGIAGADGTVTGVAPAVTFGAYRVFGCVGSTSADIMIAAMEMALADGMDVLNMSICSSRQWPQYPTAAASDRAVNAGMVVVASFGNSASTGLYSGSAPGVGKKVIGVAGYDNTHLRLPAFEVDGQPIGYDAMSFSPDPPTSGTEEIVYVGRGCNLDLPLLADPTGKVALIERGACSFREKALNAIGAGAAAVVIHNSSPGMFFGTLSSPLPDPRPVVSISMADGLYIRSLAPVDLTWTDQMTNVATPTGGLIYDSSSWGLSPDLALKPDLGAPGAFIYSTIPLENGGYATFSGTSMAAPHVAGAAALMLEAHPNTPSQAMRRILQNSADPAVWKLNPGLGFLGHVHRQGAGMVDIDDAILATTLIEPGKLSLGEGEFGPISRALHLENKGTTDVTYDLSYVNALSTGGVITPSYWLSDASVAFSAPSVLVPAGGDASVDVTVTPASVPTYGQYGGYIELTPQGGGQMYRVPYAGFVGDYQGIEVLTPTPNGFPWLAKLIGGSYFNQPGGATYTMAGGDIPYFLVHTDHQPRRLLMEVFDADNGKAWHRAMQFEYFPRSSSPTSFWSFAWDGYTVNGRKLNMVPDGDYVVKVSVLKALGDDDNPAHTEVWTSPVITIDRP
jgi:subtilisin family serine protease